MFWRALFPMLGILAILGSPFSVQAQNATSCAKTLERKQNITNISQLKGCMNFYFTHHDLDPEPGSVSVFQIPLFKRPLHL